MSAYCGPREDGLKCHGCGEFLTMDEIQGHDAHTCRISSADLPPLLIALAQAGCFGDGWEVTPDGLGFVRFDDPLAVRDVWRSLAATLPTPPSRPARDGEG